MQSNHFIPMQRLDAYVGAIDLAEAIGAVDTEIAKEVQALAFRLKPMLRALLR